MKKDVWLCVPCFNEQDRLRVDYLDQLLRIEGVGGLLLVDDGSKDQTVRVLTNAQKLLGEDRVRVLALSSNRGKGEAVRAGLNWIRLNMPEVGRVGFLDADGAVPTGDVESAIQFGLEHEQYEMVWGARVALAGRDIQRSKTRHFVARSFSTLIAFSEPSLPYDTQCGLKLFTASKSLDYAIAKPFSTRWLFDIEIYLRWKKFRDSTPAVWEHPLMSWHDIAGSKVAHPVEVGRMLAEVIQILRIAKQSASNKVGKSGS